MELQFRKAIASDIDSIWGIISGAIQRRGAEGSKQWQDGYPNRAVIEADVLGDAGFVMVLEQNIVAYVALFINNEPTYESIEGKWLSNGDFVAYHRVAVAEAYLGKGMTKELMLFIEKFALENKVYSLRADTNFDNDKMLRSFESAGYTYCGEVHFRGASRKAFEKLLL